MGVGICEAQVVERLHDTVHLGAGDPDSLLAVCALGIGLAHGSVQRCSVLTPRFGVQREQALSLCLAGMAVFGLLDHGVPTIPYHTIPAGKLVVRQGSVVRSAPRRAIVGDAKL